MHIDWQRRKRIGTIFRWCDCLYRKSQGMYKKFLELVTLAKSQSTKSIFEKIQAYFYIIAMNT